MAHSRAVPKGTGSRLELGESDQRGKGEIMTEPTKTEAEAIAEILEIMEEWGISLEELEEPEIIPS
jgi:hypothetical protein